MRKILCLLMSNKLNNVVLDECAQHSFLVEPLNDQEVLLDLSSFNKISDIVDSISQIVALEGGGAIIGLAGSPLFARQAVRKSMPQQRKNNGCRYLSCHGVKIIQIQAGKEANFLESLPITEFFPLSSRDQKLLGRMGYSSVGELKSLSPTRMRQLLKRDAILLWQNCQGIDYTPVRGIYPADRIGYSYLLPGGCKDYTRVKEICREISRIMAQELERRHVACHNIRLEMITELGVQFRERRVTQACHDAIRLGNIFQRLLPIEDITAPIEELQVVLQDLESIKMQELNLFTLRKEIQTEQRHIRRQDLLDQLQEQYPDCLHLGLRIDRRDQVLALWDPWRISFPIEIQV